MEKNNNLVDKIINTEMILLSNNVEDNLRLNVSKIFFYKLLINNLKKPLFFQKQKLTEYNATREIYIKKINETYKIIEEDGDLIALVEKKLNSNV